MLDLDEDEKILLEITPHSYFLVWPLFWSLGLAFFILAFTLAKTGFSFWFFVAFLICTGILGTYALTSYTRFYRNQAFLTNKRLWSKTQKGAFETEVKETALKDILEIEYKISGLKASVLGFGDLIIKTPGGKIKLTKVARPEKIKRQILNLKDYWLRHET